MHAIGVVDLTKQLKRNYNCKSSKCVRHSFEINMGKRQLRSEKDILKLKNLE
jgi:hypothetical protein